MRLSKPTVNAVKALLHLARHPGETLSVPALAKACDVTERTASKLVPLLVKEGFAQTDRGRSGGVRIARSAETISIGQIVRAFERAPNAPGRGQQLSLIVHEAYDEFLEILDGHSIADLARANGSTLSESAGSDLRLVT